MIFTATQCRSPSHVAGQEQRFFLHRAEPNVTKRPWGYVRSLSKWESWKFLFAGIEWILLLAEALGERSLS
jgi:hypothetical protein